jgi:hypothetical protein
LVYTIKANNLISYFTQAYFHAQGMNSQKAHGDINLTLKQYAEHWRDPFQTNAIWLGLLFSILGITMLSYHQFDNEPPEYKGSTETLFGLYRLRTAQCLMIGDIAKCLPYTVETLLLNSTAELARKDDNGRGLWMMIGVIVRAAINMGYHREPSQTSSISILEGELRRRVWQAVVTKDDLASFLIGFPSMVLGVSSDTLEPRNLHDWELSEDATVLPPSRPLNESTPVTYIIIKGPLCVLLVASMILTILRDLVLMIK